MNAKPFAHLYSIDFELRRRKEAKQKFMRKSIMGSHSIMTFVWNSFELPFGNPLSFSTNSYLFDRMEIQIDIIAFHMFFFFFFSILVWIISHWCVVLWKHVRGAWMRNSSLLTNYVVCLCLSLLRIFHMYQIHRYDFSLCICAIFGFYVHDDAHVAVLLNFRHVQNRSTL